jgi:hypothetical protein
MRRKTELLTARVTRQFKDALRIAAANESRSQANFLEVLVFAYCERRGLRGRLANLSRLSSAERVRRLRTPRGAKNTKNTKKAATDRA